MKLFQWDSQYLANYSDGTIIVVADSVKLARQKAIVEFERYYRTDDRSYLFDEAGNLYDESDLTAMEEARQLFINDISKEPTIVEDGVVFIKGSE